MFKIFNNKHINKTFHFSGIGGVSMNGLAQILHKNGYTIQGSDAVIGENLDYFINKGIKIFKGQKKENVNTADVVVRSLAIKDDNPEILQAKNLGLPIYYRHELLSEIIKNYKYSIAVSGTHGKTTCSSMIGYILRNANLDPSLNIGADLFYQKNGTYFSNSDYFVFEACEYADSFLSFSPTISCITNIEADHLDYFKDLDHIKCSFSTYIKNTEELVIYNGDDNNINDIVQKTDNKVSFGFNSKNDYYVKNIKYNEKYTEFDIYQKDLKIVHIKLIIKGKHNIYNALLAFTCAYKMKISLEIIKNSLVKFKGAKRRLEFLGEKNGILIYDDYAHHPTEIKTSLDTLKKITKGKLICIYQPHTYTRTRALYDDFINCFKKADILILADIYAAREKNIYNITSEQLKKDITNAKSIYANSFKSIEKIATELAHTGDLIVSMGAGDIWKTTYDILELNHQK